jgi:hypothetical protein
MLSVPRLLCDPLSLKEVLCAREGKDREQSAVLKRSVFPEAFISYLTDELLKEGTDHSLSVVSLLLEQFRLGVG